MDLVDQMIEEGFLEPKEDATFLRTLPPEAAYLVNEEVAFIGCDHQHEWPKDVANPCIGQPHGKELCLNMGDTFCYACADAETVKPEQCAEVADIYRRFGSTGLVCWSAKQRNEDPLIEVTERPEYWKTWKTLYGDLKIQPNFCNKSIPRW